MRYHPITLGVKRTNWSKTTMTNPGVQPAELDKARSKIMQRDDFVCQCCGFKSQKYQQLLYLDNDERNVSEQNCLTTCGFCHQCFDLSQIQGLQSGMLIWLPEIGQAALHHIMRALYIARVTQGPLAAAAMSTIDQFYKRADDVRKRLGSSDPGALAMVLQDFLSNKQYEKAAEQLRGVRLLPLDRRMIKEEGLTEPYNQFPQILAYWRGKNGPFADFNPTQWPAMIANEIRKVA
jgi:intracellular multiplication protein IcmJ